MGKSEPASGYAEWLDGVRERLRAAREAAGLSLRSAESATGVPYASIARLEAGRHDPTTLTLHKLAVGYGAPFEYILIGGSAAIWEGKLREALAREEAKKVDRAAATSAPAPAGVQGRRSSRRSS